MQVGHTAHIVARGDFEDESGVNLSLPGANYLNFTLPELASLGYVGATAIVLDTVNANVSARREGSAMLVASHTDRAGRTVQTAQAINTTKVIVDASQTGPQQVDNNLAPNVYPTTLSLEPGSTRQIKIQVGNAAQPITQAFPTGTRYVSSDESVATVDANGIITGLRPGRVTISVLHLKDTLNASGRLIKQGLGLSDITLGIEVAQVSDASGQSGPRTIAIRAAEGGIVAAPTGETVMIGAGALDGDTQVGITRINVADVEARTGMSLPVPTACKPWLRSRWRWGRAALAKARAIGHSNAAGL